MKNKGMTWHNHHSNLVEYCNDYKGRVNTIHITKAPDEIPLRLRLFKFVEGELPEEVVEACQEYTKAREEYVEAGWEYESVRLEYLRTSERYGLIWQKLESACQKRNETEEKCHKACKKYVSTIKRNLKVIEKLHAIECTDCTWDGKTIC